MYEAVKCFSQSKSPTFILSRPSVLQLVQCNAYGVKNMPNTEVAEFCVRAPDQISRERRIVQSHAKSLCTESAGLLNQCAAMNGSCDVK